MCKFVTLVVYLAILTSFLSPQWLLQDSPLSSFHFLSFIFNYSFVDNYSSSHVSQTLLQLIEIFFIGMILDCMLHFFLLYNYEVN